MTKQEFIDGYCKRSNISWDELKETQVVLPCNCGEDVCDGWAMITNTPDLVEHHIKFSSD